MKALLSAAVAAACLLATPAFAQDGGTSFNFSVGASRVESQRNNVGFTALTGRVTAAFNKYVSAEAEGSLGIGSDSMDVGGVPAKVTLRHDLAAYMVTSLPMTDNASIYARFGYGQTDIKTSAGVNSSKTSFEGVRYGVGAQFFFDDANGVRVDFTRIPDKAVKTDIYSVSYVRKF